jgi:hypothetical protein
MPPHALRFIAVAACCLLLLGSAASQEEPRLRFDVELDVLPYATGGYFGALCLRKGHRGARALYAHVHMPAFITPQGFANHQIHSFAVLGEYFFQDDQRGWWLAAGPVLWRGSIQSDLQAETAHYQALLLNGSLGYFIPLHERLYLSPWAGMSLRTSSDRRIPVDDRYFDPPLFNPEMSLKLGLRI